MLEKFFITLGLVGVSLIAYAILGLVACVLDKVHVFHRIGKLLDRR